ncbi:MAG: hypothetical protein K2H19_02555 [Ruminococcus sp.]|nr:hypothetical protein [Ruminococcus sp.]
MIVKIEDVITRYLNKECSVSVRDDVVEGKIKEIGDDWILLTDEYNTDHIVRISRIEYISIENDN